jgi:hypothetical protein
MAPHGSTTNKIIIITIIIEASNCNSRANGAERRSGR